MIIQPTVGRVVWYRPSEYDVKKAGMAVYDMTQPFAATVAYVHNDHLVNLVVWDHNGRSWTREGVRLRQAEDVLPDNSGYCEWMPYQIGQAKKYAADDSADRQATGRP